jgi:NADPH:quinone reductase-like Zn-dependent oxidoreductase
MAWQYIRIARFGGPEVLEPAEQPTIPDPGPGEVRIKVLAAGTGFTDTFIRRGRYPDFKGPLPFTPGYDLVGGVEETGPGVPDHDTVAMAVEDCWAVEMQTLLRRFRTEGNRGVELNIL